MNTKSNGLGLSICQRIAQALSGKISVTSEIGVGSTFTFEFTAQKVNLIN
jgi:signal transduction histidine kinase